MASTSSSGHAQCEQSDVNGVVCKCEGWKPLPSIKSVEKYGGARASAADGCQESSQSTGSRRACGVCEWHEDRPGNVSAFGDEPLSSLSEHIQEIPEADERNVDVDHEPESTCGADGSNPATGGSNRAAGGSNPATGGSNRVVGGSNRAAGGSNRVAGGSNRAAGGSNRAAGGSNPAAGGSNPAAGGSNRAAGGSNLATGGSNRATGGSNRGAGGSNRGAGGSNRGAGGSNPAAGGSNPATGGSNRVVGGSNRAAGGSNRVVGGSNRATGGSNPAAGGSNPATGGSNRAAGGSNPAMGGSNRGVGGSNRAAGGSNRAAGGSNRAAGGSNPAAGGSNPVAGGSNPAAGGSNPATGGSNRAAGGSNRAAGGSNPATGGSNRVVGGSNRAAGGSNRAVGGSNPATGGSNPATGGSNRAAGGSNLAAGGSNLAAGGSNRAAGGSNIADSEQKLEPKHKIFLSHSGAQKAFVDQLCVDLEQRDRYPFFDKRRSSLPIGKIFPEIIFQAIGQCRVGLVVLSEDFFTRSKWPMLELTAMVKELKKPNARMTIIPVFYLISVQDLKDPKNRREWKSKWEEWALKDERIEVREWEEALRVLGAINSLVAKDGNEDVKLRKEIVMEICQLVPLETRWDDSHVQGRARTCKVIREKMDQVCASTSVGVIGLYGMGGIGKSTICRALCNELSERFCDNVCHIEVGSLGEMELLRKALKKCTEISHDTVDKLDDLEHGQVYLKKKLRGQPIFFALDNVQDDSRSIEGALTYLNASYEPGSVVMVTARSLDVLKKLNLDKEQCLPMPELEESEARSLFLNHARVPCGNKESEELIRECIKRCHFLKSDGTSRHYHPLALRVLGQQLGPKSSRWAKQLYKIDTFNQSKDMRHPVFSILRTSFDSLKYEHQLIVMDVALFAPYVDKWLANHTILDWLCMMHEESAEDMKHLLGVLERKSLLEDVNGGFTDIGMHDLWREFAVVEIMAKDFCDRRWVYQADGKRATGRSGQWRENVHRMFFRNEGWRGLKGVNLDGFVNVEAFKLEVNGWMEDGELELDLSALKHLKSLDMSTPGDLKITLNGLSSLSSLSYLSWCDPSGFSSGIHEIGRLTNLEVLEVVGNGSGVEVLDVTELIALVVARIGGYRDLVSVRGLSSRLVSLRSLSIEYCTSLRECAGVGELYALEDLCLLGCGELEELPCLRRLTNLKVMEIGGCESLEAVPGLGDLVALEEFHASGCLKLDMLPDMVKLTKLRTLIIRECPVREVPGLEGLVSLARLDAFFGKLSGEQPDLSQLSALKELEIYGWDGPICTSIRNLLMLEDLRLFDCRGEDVVADLQNLKRLKVVVLQRCEYRDLSGLSNSTELETLWVDGCGKVERLPEFERLTKLNDLSLTGCDNLRDWPSESTLCSLHTLEVDGSSLTRLGGELEKLPGLRKLTLFGSGCENLLSMASITSRLEILHIRDFLQLEALDVGNFCQLRELKVWGCSGLMRVACSNPLAALTEVKVSNCESLVEMPDLSMFQQLVKLSLKNCGAIERLTCSRTASALTTIKLTSCNSGVEMPDSSRFPNLRSFFRVGCFPTGDDEGDWDGDFNTGDGDSDCWRCRGF